MNKFAPSQGGFEPAGQGDASSNCPWSFMGGKATWGEMGFVLATLTLSHLNGITPSLAGQQGTF